MLRLFFLVLIFEIANVNAQDNNSSLLKGRVSTSDSVSIGSIHVINKTRGSATITDEKGYFQIFSSTNDTLLFSAVQFRIKIIVD